MKIAIVGLGNFGRLHLDTFMCIKNCEIIALCDKNKKILNQLSKKYNIKNIYTDFDKLLENPKIDAVDIVVDEKLHYDFTKRSLNKNKHVFLEKPLALEYSQAKELEELALKTKRTLIVGQILRFDARNAALYQRINEGKLGEIRHIYCRRNFTKSGFDKYGRIHPFLTGAIHDIDQIIWLSNDKITSVYAIEKFFYNEKNPDSLIAVLNLKNGATAIIENVWHLPENNPFGFEFQLEIIGSKETIKISNQPDLDIWSEKNITKHKELDINIKKSVDYPELFFTSKVHSEYSGALRYELDHFVDCVHKSKQSEIIKLTQISYGIKIANKLIESAKEKKIINIE